jgi:hypothetical protein
MANKRKAKEEAKAKIAKSKEDTKTHNAEWNMIAESLVDQARLKKWLSRMNWRGEPLKGLV